MKLKKQFLLRDIAGEHILVPVGESSTAFNGLITMNDVGIFIWENLKEVENEEEMLQKILDEYEVEEKTAREDMEEFLDKLRQVDII